jgi:methylene-fatty-acyl-phospholipid synthase
MEILQTLRSELLAIDFRNPKILLSIITIIFNPIFWNVIGRLEYHTKLFTKLSGGRSKLACYIFAVIVFSLGIFRDYM